jgi:hypothetical protein
VSTSDPVRDALPIERISYARIRQLLSSDEEMGGWSKGSQGAIRPGRLAMLIRERIWNAHDVSLDAIRARLPRGTDTALVYRVEVEVDVGDRYLKMVSRTRFSRSARGSICADIDLSIGAASDSITGSSIVLRGDRE